MACTGEVVRSVSAQGTEVLPGIAVRILLSQLLALKDGEDAAQDPDNPNGKGEVAGNLSATSPHMLHDRICVPSHEHAALSGCYADGLGCVNSGKNW